MTCPPSFYTKNGEEKDEHSRRFVVLDIAMPMRVLSQSLILSNNTLKHNVIIEAGCVLGGGRPPEVELLPAVAFRPLPPHPLQDVPAVSFLI